MRWERAPDGNGHHPHVWGPPSSKWQLGGVLWNPWMGCWPCTLVWSVCSALLPKGLDSRVGTWPFARVEVSMSLPLSPPSQPGQLWRSPVLGQCVFLPMCVCESGSWSGFQRMFFLAGPCGGRGRRGPRQGHVQLSRQRPADWVVTGPGRSASASQALGEGGRGAFT